RVAIIVSLCATVSAQSARPGKNFVTIRGHEQRVYFYQGSPAGHHRKILFAPGDAGCRGFAVDIAERLSKDGYDTYCLDVLHYLQSFTGRAVLTAAQVTLDFGDIARWIEASDHTAILLVGWSEGAGLSLAAAATPENKVLLDGIIVIGLPEQTILSWHWKDVGAWFTKKAPHEPTFKSADLLPRVSPLPLFVIGSTSTQWVSPEATRQLFSIAHEPKRLDMVAARDHKYSDNTAGFFNALRDGVNWIQQAH